MTTLLLLVLLHLSFYGNGLLVRSISSLSQTGLKPKATIPPGILASGTYFLGALATVLVLYLSCCIPHSSPLVFQTVLWISVVTGLFVLGRSTTQRAEFSDRKLSFPLRLSPPPLKSLPKHSLWFAAALACAFAGALILMRLTRFPFIAYDANAFWLQKALHFAHGGWLFDEFFVHRERIHPHPGYPNYLPLFYAAHFALTPASLLDGEWLAKLGITLHLFAGICSFYFLSAWRAGCTAGILLCALLLCSPQYSASASIQGSIVSGVADVPLSFFFLGSVAYFSYYLSSKHPLLLLFSTASVASAALLKDEGFTWALLYLLLVSAAWFSRKDCRKNLQLAALVIAVLLLALTCLKLPMPDSSDLQPLSWQQFTYLGNSMATVIGHAIHHLFTIDEWGLLFVVIVPGLLYALSASRHSLATLVILYPLTQLVVYMGVMSLIDIQLHQLSSYMAVTFWRLLLHLVPAFLFVVVTGINREAVPRKQSLLLVMTLALAAGTQLLLSWHPIQNQYAKWSKPALNRSFERNLPYCSRCSQQSEVFAGINEHTPEGSTILVAGDGVPLWFLGRFTFPRKYFTYSRELRRRFLRKGRDFYKLTLKLEGRNVLWSLKKDGLLVASSVKTPEHARPAALPVS